MITVAHKMDIKDILGLIISIIILIFGLKLLIAIDAYPHFKTTDRDIIQEINDAHEGYYYWKNERNNGFYTEYQYAHIFGKKDNQWYMAVRGTWQEISKRALKSYIENGEIQSYKLSPSIPKDISTIEMDLLRNSYKSDGTIEELF